MARAVFLDRDGVLNRNILYADTGAWESPRTAGEVELTTGIAAALHLLRSGGYLLIVVSNQPNAAKGKCSREALDQVHERLAKLLGIEGIVFDAHYLCFHHPEHTGSCDCRKPSPFFLVEAAARFGIDLEQSWMIGDRASDVACGHAAGTRTVWIDNGEGVAAPSGEGCADLVAGSVPDAVMCLLRTRPKSNELVQKAKSQR